MKVVVLMLGGLSLVGPVLAWVYVDGPTAAMFLAGTVLVCICAAMPVVFSVVTRRNDLRRMAREEAEEIGIGKSDDVGTDSTRRDAADQ
jgi:phosphotransferase system  glucose/maltose/N-acetylglucosamine-specific IIC component